MPYGKHSAKVSKRGITERKWAKIENPYLIAHLHNNMNSHISFQDNPSIRLGGVAITGFFSSELQKGVTCNKGPDQETV